MPGIINGKYVNNPRWADNQQPPISADNLNDISDTLQRLDAGGGGGKRYASVVVGTSTAGWTAADCDYLCDGTDDNVEIQAAKNSLPATGGEIVLLAGTYHLSAIVTFLGPPVRLRGAGAGITVIEIGNSPGFSFNFSSELGPAYVEITGMTFRASTPVRGVTSTVQYIRVFECEFIDCQLYISGLEGGEVLVEGNVFQKTKALGNVDMLTLSNSYSNTNCLVVNNRFSSKSSSNGDFVNTLDSNGVVFFSNILAGQGQETVRLRCDVISGNTFMNCSFVNCEEARNFSCNNVRDCARVGIGGLTSGGTSNPSMGKPVSVTGNTMMNSSLYVYGPASVTGNSIQNAPNYGIEVIPGNPVDYAYTTPIVEGNNIIFEEGSTTPGILLMGGSYPVESTHYGAVVLGNKIINTTVPIEIRSKWSNCCVVNNFFNTGTITDAGSNNTKRDNGPQMSS